MIMEIDHNQSHKNEMELLNLGLPSNKDYMLWLLSKPAIPTKVLRCCYCERELTTNRKSPTFKTKEHVIPKSKGGTKTLPCCAECNTQRRDLDLEVFIFLLETEYKKAFYEIDKEFISTKIKNAKMLFIESSKSSKF